MIDLPSDYNFNLLTAVPAKTGHTRLHCFKTLQLSQSREHCLKCQLWALGRTSFKLGYPISAKRSALFAKYCLLNLDKNKTVLTVFDVIEKRQKSAAFRLFTDIIVAKPKVNIHSKIQSLFQLRSASFCFYSFHEPSYSLLFWCILALPRFSISRLHCMPGNSQNFWQHSILPPLFHI